MEQNSPGIPRDRDTLRCQLRITRLGKIVADGLLELPLSRRVCGRVSGKPPLELRAVDD